MTRVPGNDSQDKTISIVTLKDPVRGAVPAICVRIDKKNEGKVPATSQEHRDDDVLSPSAVTTCRKKYPPGCTILECRLDASNRPVAQVLQVDQDPNARKMSLLVEAKQTPRGPYSRVTSRLIEDTGESSNEGVCSKETAKGRTYALESGDTSKDHSYDKEGPISRILYGEVPEEPEESTKCHEERRESPKVEGDSIKDKITENVLKLEEIVCRCPPNCMDKCPGVKKSSRSLQPKTQVDRRNGLDPTGSEIKLWCFKEEATKRRLRGCPESCRKAAVKSLQEKPKSSVSLEPKVTFQKSSKEFTPSPSEDSLDRYKDYVSPGQLEKYRACRAKRNGLQDECFLPLPRAFLENTKQDSGPCDDEKNENGLAGKNSEISQIDEADRASKSSQQVQEPAKKSPKSSTSTRSSQKSVVKKKRRLKKVKSRELYAGQVFIDCDCYHRNGLQHDCPRSGCGVDPCMKRPQPNCNLGSYFVDKWNKYHDKLDRVMPTAYCGSEEQWQDEISRWKFRHSAKNNARKI